MAPPAVTNPAGGFNVDFSIFPNPARVGTVVTFTDFSSSPGHALTSHTWNWSDGATKTGSSVVHDFGAAGTYTVTLKVTDDLGQESFRTKIITITP
jgi:PKD repeat protein